MLLPQLNLKSFILCTLWLQTPYDEGEFKSILEYALFQFAYSDIDDKEASNSAGEDDDDSFCSLTSADPSPFEEFLSTYKNPDDRNIILLSKLHTRLPHLLSGNLEKERMLNSLILNRSDLRSSNENKIEELRSDKVLVSWEIKMNTLAHLAEFIKKCVLDTPYKVALAAASSPVGKFFASKIKSLENKMNHTLDTTKKNLELSLRFMHLLTQDLPEDDFDEALNRFLADIQSDDQVNSGGLTQILANYLEDIKQHANTEKQFEY